MPTDYLGWTKALPCLNEDIALTGRRQDIKQTKTLNNNQIYNNKDERNCISLILVDYLKVLNLLKVASVIAIR